MNDGVTAAPSSSTAMPRQRRKVEARGGDHLYRESMPGRWPTHEPRALFCSAMPWAAFRAFAVQCLELGAALGLCRRGAPNFSQACFVRSAKAVTELASRSGRAIVAHWLRFWRSFIEWACKEASRPRGGQLCRETSPDALGTPARGMCRRERENAASLGSAPGL